MNPSACRDEMLALMGEMEAKPIHVQHVAGLALQLFDQLEALHGLGPRERLLLEAAGYLHDIGHQFDFRGEGHHKESARLIRQYQWKNFDGAEVEVIAQVARYHRKAMPDFTHDEFKALNDGDRRLVRQLAGLLRLADSLNRTHGQLVSGVRVELRPNQILLHLETVGPVEREVKAARQKGDLAQAVFQRDLVFMVGGQELGE